MKRQTLTDFEIERVAEATIRGSGGLALEDMIWNAVQWAHAARIQQKLLDGVLAGKIVVDARRGEPRFN